MQNEEEPVAKRTEGNLVEYVCPVCGGWDRLCEVYRAFLPFIDHLIQDLCLKEHPKLQQPFLVDNYVWFRIPGGDEIIHGLRGYEPNAQEWKRLLEKKEKILPQAKLFLPDIADWLQKALASIEQLNSIAQSDLLVAGQLVELVKGLPDEFQEQREYLLQHEDKLKDTGMDLSGGNHQADKPHLSRNPWRVRAGGSPRQLPENSFARSDAIRVAPSFEPSTLEKSDTGGNQRQKARQSVAGVPVS